VTAGKSKTVQSTRCNFGSREAVMNDEDSESEDDDEEICLPIGLENAFDGGDFPTLHYHKDMITVYDGNRSVSCHFFMESRLCDVW
jgi:hypothetical protein